MPDGLGAQRPRGDIVAVLAKAPIPGFAKTRLIPRLGANCAAALHGLMVARTLRTAVSAGFAGVSLWCTPSQADPFFQTCRREGEIRLMDQPHGDLGYRMFHAFETHLVGGGPVVLIGTDCPSLSVQHLQEARATLNTGVDAVFVPSLDGGYAAIGLRRIDRLLFTSIAWGTSDVMAVTRSRLRALGWSYHELPAVRDVDRPEDVEWLLSSGLLDARELKLLMLREK